MADLFTIEQIANLQKLANHLSRVEPERFCMEFFVGSGKCGTTHCALGYLPEALEEEPTDYVGYFPYGHFDWDAYSLDRLGMDSYDQKSDVWLFLFGAAWSKYDNSPQGAADRINHLLRWGLPKYMFGIRERELPDAAAKYMAEKEGRK